MPDPMTLLKADHREAKQLLNALGDSDEGRERERMLEQLEAALALHMQLEEELLYPLVREHIGADDAEEADIEHGLARDGLAKLRELVRKPGFGAAVEMLKGGITHHVHEEETEILPELKSAVERDDWMAIGEKIAVAKQEAGMAVPSARRRSSKRTSSTKTKK